MNNNHLDQDNDNTEVQRARRISDISQQIEALSIELNDLLQLNQENEIDAAFERPPARAPAARAARGQAVQAVAVPAVAAHPPAFEVGQQVVILNNYQGLRGFQGEIIRVTRHQVTLRLNGQDRIVVRSRNNVRLVD